MELNPEFGLEPVVLKYKILVLGDSGAGKTSIVRRIVKETFTESYSATVGVDFSVKVISIGKDFEIRLQLWDLAGQDRFNHLSRLYYKEASGVLLVCDETRADGLDTILRWKGELDARLQPPIPAVLLVNKADLLDFEGSGLNDKDIEDTCNRLSIGCWSRTSAKDGYGVDECMKALVWDILASNERRRSQAAEEATIIRLEKSDFEDKFKKGSGCC